MRLFLAIELSESLRRQIVHLSNHLQERLGPDSKRVSWVKPQNLHVTLKFLGQVDEPHVPALCEALASVDPVGEFPLLASHLEFLPNRGPLRIISAAMNGDLHRLEQLHHRIETACAQLGFPTDRRKFLPHITFARIHQRPTTPPHDMAQYAQNLLPTESMAVREFVLMQSHLKKEGAEYVRMARFPNVKPA